MRETMDQLTWQTPRLERFSLTSSSQFSGDWFVRRFSYEDVLYDPFGETAKQAEYLRVDGTWHTCMNINRDNRQPGGTYFKTLNEVLNVLCEFGIDVVGEEE